MKITAHILTAIAALLLAGCSKYTDIKTQGQLVPGQLINYRYMLNNTAGYEVSVAISDYASDDVQYVDSSSQMTSLLGSDYYGYVTNSYRWLPDIYPIGGSYYQDYNWNNMYNAVTNANIVINEVPNASDGTKAEKDAIIAEALVHRADAYLCLVNTYAKPYNASTAATDLGVPLVLIQTTSQSLNRASVQATYNQILADLKKALLSLPATQVYNTLPSKPSAFGELARCYLYMNQYDSAAVYADSALKYRSTLNDLGPITTLSSATYPVRKSDPEVLLSKTPYYNVTAYSPYAMRLSDTLLSLLGTKDQRYNLFTTAPSTISSLYTTAGGRFFYKDRAIGETRNTGPSVPEMMLIKAEAYARKGDAANAMTWVNNLRVKRFKPADYVPLTATGTADALLKVIQEREREFFCRMLRWWDMRRLKSEAAFQTTITRKVNGVTYTLAPNSDR
ncbi:MAG: RagB/SusD family nutrient uptake outer membrane protein, partial [Bacteroidetes bacterium]|nr:RagB/SusD family nutrient uptake outer membrane protein [Bacteroidota bacterium]